MKLKDCVVGDKVKDNLKLKLYNWGTGTITGFCETVFNQKAVLVYWDKAERCKAIVPENINKIL